MKELFERHRPRMTPEEDQKLWGRLEKKLAPRPPAWRAWRIPAGVAAAATAAVAVVVLVRGTGVDRPAMPEGLEVREAPAPAIVEKSEAGSTREMDAPPSAAAPGRDSRADLAPTAETPAAPSPPAAARAVEGTITGKVTDERGQPLTFAYVTLEGTSFDALTDSLGRFRIDGVPAGRYVAQVSFLGYDPKELAVNLDSGATPDEQVVLTEAAFAAVGEGRVEEDRASSPHTVRAEDLSRLPADVLQDAERLKSGVVSQGGQLHFRGGRSNETRVEVGAEGKAVPAPEAPRSLAMSPVEPRQDLPKKDASGWPVSVGGTDPVNGQAFDAMFFEHYGVNPFVDPEDDRFATFAVDVDNASYTLTRSYLQRGELPPREAVRVEEFVNAFTHDYAPPRSDLVASRDWAPSEHGTFAIHLEAAPSPFGKDLILFRVGLKGRNVTAAERKPAVLTFVIDVSGSMQRENRLELVKRALFLLLDQMDRRDRVALVVYGSNARVVLPHTSLAERRVIEDAIARLVPEGSTNAEAGLRQAYALADRSFERGYINRVILCSDGVANVGQTGAEDILREIKAQARRGIYLTTVGFGMGNYNDILMEKLANQGDGNYTYVDDISEARRVFVENLTGTLQTIARDTKIQVEFDPDRVRRYRLLGYENRDVADQDFRNDTVDAGEVGAGHEVTALFEMRLDRGARGNLATVRIRYEDPESGKVTEEARALRAEDVHDRLANADPSFRLDAAVAEFAEILRHSYWAKDGDLARVHSLARQAARSVARPDEAEEVLSMIEAADRLRPVSGAPQWRDDVRPEWDPEDDRR